MVITYNGEVKVVTQDFDTSRRADYVFDKIKEAFSNLSDLSDRGAYPKELLALGISEYREIFL